MKTTTECPGYGEPWEPLSESGIPGAMFKWTGVRDFNRAVACVNACAGMADPATEIASLRNALHLAESAAQSALDERDVLARWKEEMLTLNRWWDEVDAAVRKHPDAVLGRSVSDTALRFIQERDELQSLRWVPVTERMPTLDDASEYGDVEWSDGKTVWECRHDDPERATHWRKYTLP